jgi:hypothetical protein
VCRRSVVSLRLRGRCFIAGVMRTANMARQGQIFSGTDGVTLPPIMEGYSILSLKSLVQESIPFSKYRKLISGGQPRPGMVGTYRLKVGRCTTSVSGTVSSGFPALRQAARPPTMTNALNPHSRKRCATLALVASFWQVQYR